MRLMFAFAVATVCVALEGLPARANDTAPPAPAAGLHHHYDVYYRECAHDRWRLAGSYDCEHAANKAARRLAHQGYQTRVRCHH